MITFPFNLLLSIFPPRLYSFAKFHKFRSGSAESRNGQWQDKSFESGTLLSRGVTLSYYKSNISNFTYKSNERWNKRLRQRTLTYFVRGSITVVMADLLLEPNKLICYLFSWIQTKNTGGQLYLQLYFHKVQSKWVFSGSGHQNKIDRTSIT